MLPSSCTSNTTRCTVLHGLSCDLKGFNRMKRDVDPRVTGFDAEFNILDQEDRRFGL